MTSKAIFSGFYLTLLALLVTLVDSGRPLLSILVDITLCDDVIKTASQSCQPKSQ